MNRLKKTPLGRVCYVLGVTVLLVGIGIVIFVGVSLLVAQSPLLIVMLIVAIVLVFGLRDAVVELFYWIRDGDLR